LNHRDLLVAESRYGRAKPPERVPLGDGAGVVLALGPAAGAPAPVKVGDRVTAAHFLRWLDGPFRPEVFEQDLGNSADGWASEHVLLPAAALLRIPDGIGDPEAAALGAAGITAWTVIETLGRAKPGDVVLTLGTGGVSIVALQIAKLFGARVAITSSSDDKLAVARRLGADIAINYRSTPQWPERVLAETGGRGADIVVETVGLGTLDQSVACCAPNARIGLLGALAPAPDGGVAKPWGALIGRNLTIKGITSGSRAQLDDLLRAAAANGLRPHVDRTFPFEQLPEAYRYLAGGGHVGKVVIAFP
jgi:NADPH:quinone reductase-like Zn-dependent oxidoreductase